MRMLRILIFPVLLAGLARANDQDLGTAGWIEKLTASYAKLEGFTATYRSELSRTAIESTQGMDEASGLAANHTASRNGRLDFKSWFTAEDELFLKAFVPAGETFTRYDLARARLSRLEAIMNQVVLGKDMIKNRQHRATPRFLYRGSTVDASVEVIALDKPPWADAVAGAEVERVDGKSVTFSTTSHGSLTIGREHGMVIRQKLAGQDGVPVVLELTDFQADPGKAAVEKISAGWSGTGAKPEKIATLTATLRLASFQTFVSAVDGGKSTDEELAENLENRRDALRELADFCLEDQRPSAAVDQRWQDTLGPHLKRLREEWKTSGGTEDLATYLAFQERRNATAAAIARDAGDLPGMKQEAAAEILGPLGIGSLVTTNEAGVMAGRTVEAALARAYAEAAARRAMEKFWSREALEAQDQPTAAPAARSTADWIEEMTAAYGKLDGYTAVYRSKTKSGELESKLGLHVPTGLGVNHTRGTKDGKLTEMRMWLTADDEMLMERAGQVGKIVGIRRASEHLFRTIHKLQSANPPKISANFRATPLALLASDQVMTLMGFINSAVPPWSEYAREGTIEKSDAKTVTIATPEYGRITIGREHGLVVRQEILRTSGETRVLELTELRLNPGAEAVEAISAGWDTTGATTVPAGLANRDVQTGMLQGLIAGVENGGFSSDDLGKRLDIHREALKDVADACIMDHPLMLAFDSRWKTALDKQTPVLRELWTKGGRKTDFATFLANPELRKRVREEAATEMEGIDEPQRRALRELLGPAGAETLTSTTEPGAGAKAKLVAALARAYYEAAIERSMKKLWTEEMNMD